MKKYNLYNFIFIFILSITFSCTPMKKITYLNDGVESEWDLGTTPPKHSLEVGDLSLIHI